MRINSLSDDLLDFSSLPPLVDPPFSNTINSPPSSSSKPPPNGNYFPSYLINNNIQNQIPSYNIATNQENTFSHQPQNQIQIQNSSSQLQQNMLSNYSYNMQQGNHNNTYIYGLDNKECKMEQFSTNNSMVSVSQDTCLSNDINTDTSSVVSKQEIGRNTTLYEDFECPSSIGPLSNFESLWNDY